MVDAATESALSLSPPEAGDKAGADLMKNVLKALKRLLSTILRKDTNPACLHTILKYLGRWLNSEKGHQRTWMIEV